MIKKTAFAVCSLLLPGMGQLLERRIGWALACALTALIWWFLPAITRSVSLSIIAGHKDPMPVLLRWQAGYERLLRLLWFMRATVHAASACDAGRYPDDGNSSRKPPLAQRILVSALGIGTAACLVIPASLTA